MRNALPPVAIGNGRNDRTMLSVIALVQREGAAAEALASVDVVRTSIRDALDLLLDPKRLTGTPRS